MNQPTNDRPQLLEIHALVRVIPLDNFDVDAWRRHFRTRLTAVGVEPLAIEVADLTDALAVVLFDAAGLDDYAGHDLGSVR